MVIRTQTKLILLFSLLLAAFIAASLFLTYSERHKLNLLFQQEKNERKILVDRILSLKSASLHSFVNDYTFFDEMVQFVRTGDRKWAAENIETALTTFNANVAWVYKTDFSLVYSTDNLQLNIQEIPLPEEAYSKLFIKNHFVVFYIQTSHGLLEIHGATIHPTSDYERKTPAQGYFFVGRLWTKNYIDEISNLTDSSIIILSFEGADIPESPKEHGQGVIVLSRGLPGWDGNPLVTLSIRYESPLIQEFNRSSRLQFAMFIIFALIFLTLAFLAVMRWMSIPLGQISRSLQTAETAPIESLLKNRTEFGEIAALIGKFFAQKENLVNEINERKQVEEALRKSEERYRELAELLPLTIFEMDTQGIITFANRYAFNTFGYTEHDLESGMHVLQMLIPEERNRAEEDIRRVLNEENLGGMEYTLLKADGGTFPAIVYVSLIISENKSVGVRGVVLDITEHKIIEEERLRTQKLESLGVLAGGIAHDFNNLLAGILGNISLAKMLTKPQEEVYDILQEAEGASIRARDITRQLLTFSKGGAPVKKAIFIDSIIKDSAAFALRGSNVKYECSIPDSIWPLEVDEGQMVQVINNLIINADQAMPEGGVIRISAENVTISQDDMLPLNKGRYVKITIEDRGTGIPREHLQKIFDPYFSTKQKGSGLGLATVYSIIRNHGGYVAVESTLGIGTTFSLYLPVSEKEISQTRSSEKETILFGKGKILIMDDEEVVRQTAGRMLKHMGYTAEFCSDGNEAIVLYQKAMESGEPYDAVLIDLTIPGGKGGKETIENLLKIDPHMKGIVSSGYSNDPVLADFREYGFTNRVIKPFKMMELSEILYKVVMTKGQQGD
ncbi:MAG: ATP-binding protein [Nitrospirota bacterium]